MIVPVGVWDQRQRQQHHPVVFFLMGPTLVFGVALPLVLLFELHEQF